MLETVSFVPDPRQVGILDFRLLLFPLRGLLLPSCLDHFMLPPVTGRMLLLWEVADHAEYLSTFALDHRAAFRSLDGYPITAILVIMFECVFCVHMSVQFITSYDVEG